MPRIAILTFALAGLSLAGCASTATVSSNLSSSATTIATDVQAITTLNATILNQVAAANPNNAAIQTLIANIKAGNAIAAAEAPILVAGLSAVGITVTAAALVGKTVNATVTTASQ